MSLLTLTQAEAKYGPILGRLWANEGKFCGLLEIPAEIGSGWTNSLTGASTTHIYCNLDMHEPLLNALQNVLKNGYRDTLRTFDGCFNIRPVRGEPNKPSWHAYALAIDLDADVNPMGTPGELPDGFVNAFLSAGFVWGGEFQGRTDPMHFQWGLG